ncbi:MAG TPA: glutamate-1-semialdehyde 2,1-aminomutase [Acidimicrobiales bacterium]|nr:glutamate-1-semialdehyde 2,1-aminomutase [Acidimicrobiales bacterium]
MTDSNNEMFERAQTVIPGGVNSPVRAFRSVGGTPYVVAHGAGAYVTDVAGRRYVDWVQSYGATILGHAHEKVVAAVADAARAGTSFGAPTPGEVRLAELVVARVPGVEQLRLTSSGTEATMSALRLARAATGRHGIIVFDGCYHGHSDQMLAAGGSGMATLGVPASAGVTPAAVAETAVVPYNTVPEIGADVAAVIVEPIAANMGLVPPAPGFLEGLRASCDKAGALLIFDEVITGFRVGPGGASGRLGIRPDLWCFGKVLGGGLPLAGFAGSAELMAHLAPLGPVYQAGTLSGNPIATAAGAAVLELLTESAYEQLETTARALAKTLADALGGGFHVPRCGPLVGIFCRDEPVRHYDDAKAAAATGRYPALFHGMLERGIALAPGAYEILFPGLAHGPEEIEKTAEAAGATADSARKG